MPKPLSAYIFAVNTLYVPKFLHLGMPIMPQCRHLDIHLIARENDFIFQWFGHSPERWETHMQIHLRQWHG